MEYAVVVGLVVVACLSGISYLGRTTTAEAGRKSQLGAPDTGEAAPPTSAPNATTTVPASAHQRPAVGDLHRHLGVG